MRERPSRGRNWNFKLTHVPGVPRTLPELPLQVILIGTLCYAIVASLLIHLFGWLIGLLVLLAAAGLFAMRQGAYFHRVAVQIFAPSLEK